MSNDRFLLGLQGQRLHAFGGSVHGLEVVEHTERTFDHLALDVTVVRNADVVGHVADDKAIATDKAELCAALNYVPSDDACLSPLTRSSIALDIASSSQAIRLHGEHLGTNS